MAITDLTVFQAMREKLKFHEQRQRLLSENMANASTPGFQGRDLERPDFFKQAMEEARAPMAISTAVTAPGHVQAGFTSNSGHFSRERMAGYEVTPDGNAVVLEEQMMKVADNQMDFQLATTLYQRSIGLLKTAIGKR